MSRIGSRLRNTQQQYHQRHNLTFSRKLAQQINALLNTPIATTHALEQNSYLHWTSPESLNHVDPLSNLKDRLGSTHDGPAPPAYRIPHYRFPCLRLTSPLKKPFKTICKARQPPPTLQRIWPTASKRSEIVTTPLEYLSNRLAIHDASNEALRTPAGRPGASTPDFKTWTRPYGLQLRQASQDSSCKQVPVAKNGCPHFS
ncbi:unnamed protein product [Caenorhabditis nigoni]